MLQEYLSRSKLTYAALSPGMKCCEHDLVLALAVPVPPAVAGVAALGFKKVQ